jgi:hypothetical protein
MSFPSNETAEAIQEFGCLTPNCRQSYWEVTSERTFTHFYKNNTMVIQYTLGAGLQVV